jgi:PAS domain S-box-containing protein
MSARADGPLHPDAEHFRHVMERNPMPTVISKVEDGTILSINTAFRDLLGYDAAELVGRPLGAFDVWVHPEERAVLVDRLRREGRVTGLEIEVRSKAGAVLDILASAEPIELDGEECLVGVFHDITARARAEREVERLNQRLLSILAAAGDGLFGLDREGRCTFVNPAASAALGYSADELVGRVMHEVVHHSHADGSPYPLAECPATRTLEQGVACRVEDEVMWRRNGTPMPVEYTSHPIFENGVVIGAVVLFHDVTERRRAEELLVTAHAQAEQASAAKTEFLSRMSHELRTPLNAILGFGQLLEMEDLDPDHRESVGHIVIAGRHLLEMINEVLDISRIESGRLHLSIEPVRAAEPLEEALGMVRPLAAARNVEVPDAVEGVSEVFVRADRHRLKQVLLNLLSNAVKYNRDGGSVGVRCDATAEGRVRIVVEDTGIGIREHDFERLFLPFVRLGAQQADVEGTGLGLTLSRRLVEAMDGELTVRSEVGRGSSFTVELPPAGAPLAGGSREGATPREVRPGSGRAATVLYVEDNLANVKLMERLMTRRPGLTLLVAIQGSLAIDLAREHRPDLVLLDLNLPDIPGEEVLRRLRADPATATVPVIVVSGDATPGQADRLLAAGADDYITKPFDIARLLGVIDALG